MMLAGSFPFSVSAQEPVATPQTQAQPAAAPQQSTEQPAQPTSQTPAGQPVPRPDAQATKDNNGTFTIRQTARLVVLDMVVTDAKGNIVTDLKRDDFHVTELNEPQTILNFEVAGSHTLKPEMNINSTADLDRVAPRAPVNIILLDEFNTHFEDMAFARYSLKKYLERETGKLSTPTMLIAVDLENAVQECVNVLRDARVTLYTIDPAGLQVNPGEYGAGAAFNDPFGGNYEFNRLAKATGGRTLYGRNDVDAEIGTAIRDGSSFYTLTYRPQVPPTNLNKFYRIKVTVDRPGLTVTTREGYYLQFGPGRVDPVKPSRRLLSDLAAADSSTMAYDGVPMTLEASPTDPYSFTVHVDGRGLAWTYATDTEPRHAEVVLMVSTFDKKDKEVNRDAKVIKVSAPASVPPTGRLLRNLDVNYKLDHNPKAVRARFVVRVTASGRIGTADAVLGQQTASSKPTP